MRRPRLRTAVLLLAVAGVLVVAGGFAFFALTGDDAPAPAAVPQGAAVAGVPSGTWMPAAGDPGYTGYRVHEKYLGVGVRTAVGRTHRIAGSAVVRGGRIVAARLAAQFLGALHSDEARRDQTLETKALETARFPGARFTLIGPVALSGTPVAARGTLELHGAKAPVALRVAAARSGRDGLVVAGSAPISFKTYNIVPPSIAGFVTVDDHGTLEFRLRLVLHR
jgi:polyisoprenoid-binding protein YceI